MLAVDKDYRKKGLGSMLVQKAIEAMKEDGCDEAVLETEVINGGALKLYENLGFIREKRLHMYYLNQGSAYRLKLYLK
jgi:peptide alpha-N-acetyltransferase